MDAERWNKPFPVLFPGCARSVWPSFTIPQQSLLLILFRTPTDPTIIGHLCGRKTKKTKNNNLLKQDKMKEFELLKASNKLQTAAKP